jgi:hypothetical protein
MSNADAKELEGEDLDLIEAEFVTVKQSTVRAIEGGHIEMQQVGALSIDGERIEIAQSASALIHGTEVGLNQSISAITTARNIALNYSFAPLSLSREKMDLNRCATGIVIARNLNAEKTSSLLMIANRVEGEVTTVLDWRSALALGAIAGGVIGLISLFSKK